MVNGGYQFPGRWIGGVALIAGPLVWLTGVWLRLPFHFFFPQQLAAYQQAPARMFAAYSCVLVGQILVALGVIAAANVIGRTRPALATWGGLLVVLGLFARTFHAGVDHLAFQLVAPLGLERATAVIGGIVRCGAHVARAQPAIMFGWPVLALGAWRAGVLPWWRALALAGMLALMMGVLKGSSWVSVAALVGLAIAFVPLGIRLLADGPRPAAARGRGVGRLRSRPDRPGLRSGPDGLTAPPERRVLKCRFGFGLAASTEQSSETPSSRKWRNWQTHQLEGLAVAIPWGFESPLSAPTTYGDSERALSSAVAKLCCQLRPFRGVAEQAAARTLVCPFLRTPEPG